MAGSMNLSLEESSVASENKLSASTANSSNGILTDAAIADGKKQENKPFFSLSILRQAQHRLNYHKCPRIDS